MVTTRLVLIPQGDGSDMKIEIRYEVDGKKGIIRFHPEGFGALQDGTVRRIGEAIRFEVVRLLEEGVLQ